MVNALTTKGRLLVSAINTTGTNVIDAASPVVDKRSGNADGLSDAMPADKPSDLLHATKQRPRPDTQGKSSSRTRQSGRQATPVGKRDHSRRTKSADAGSRATGSAPDRIQTSSDERRGLSIRIDCRASTRDTNGTH